ncbi:MAG: nuclear transport factor 2 family protein [Pseudomonadales bacterium]
MAGAAASMTDHNIQNLLDKQALLELAQAYASAVDRRDYVRFATTFTEDGRLSGPGFNYNDRAEIESNIAAIEQFSATQHHVTNQLVMITGDAATGETYCMAGHIYEKDGQQRKMDMAIRYQDEFIRTGTGWKIKSRVLEVDWVQDLPLQG